jgi:hypothetical protein
VDLTLSAASPPVTATGRLSAPDELARILEDYAALGPRPHQTRPLPQPFGGDTHLFRSAVQNEQIFGAISKGRAEGGVGRANGSQAAETDRERVGRQEAATLPHLRAWRLRCLPGKSFDAFERLGPVC